MSKQYVKVDMVGNVPEEVARYVKVEMAGPVKQLLISGGQWTLDMVQDVIDQTFPTLIPHDIQVAITAESDLIFSPLPKSTLFGSTLRLY